MPVDLGITRCLADLASLGYSDATLLETGMQGLVFRLDEQLVAKVWPGASVRQVNTLNDLQAFYRALARHDLPFMTPEIHQIVRLEDTMVTIERALPGAQLRSRVVEDRASVQRSTIGCLSAVLQALASIGCSADLAGLPVLGEAEPMARVDHAWSKSFVALLQRRVTHFGDQLRRSV